MSITDNHTDEEIRKIYNFRNIAVVGMSRDSAKAAHSVPKYMMERGFNIIPVNPMASEILGRRTYSYVSDIKSQVDIIAVSYTHLRAHETPEHLVCRLLLEKKKKK